MWITYVQLSHLYPREGHVSPRHCRLRRTSVADSGETASSEFLYQGTVETPGLALNRRDTLPKTNIAPKNREISSSNHPFSGANYVSFRESNIGIAGDTNLRRIFDTCPFPVFLQLKVPDCVCFLAKTQMLILLSCNLYQIAPKWCSRFPAFSDCSKCWESFALAIRMMSKNRPLRRVVAVIWLVALQEDPLGWSIWMC